MVSNQDTNIKDQWQLALDDELVKIKACQEKEVLNSCMQCAKVLECELRKTYVKAVYSSMNKGSGGGFEF